MIKHEITTYCLDFLNGSNRLEDVNQTNIVLIPKSKGANHMTSFRPMSLCKVLYKIIAKVLASQPPQASPT
ncbi:hypothetical protein AXF42_Ash001192 [Apostasia shenzhenica]|uniref:Reverse transcriptase domain-containing protein n=1 Tax=Apostasia shenzhenica TaxID=1088818 RepID=A0A2I0AU65_9ASPA|nr:hypothetical protein AXF42_Ash001192 [Apostasia shenzhenica]